MVYSASNFQKSSTLPSIESAEEVAQRMDEAFQVGRPYFFMFDFEGKEGVFFETEGDTLFDIEWSILEPPLAFPTWKPEFNPQPVSFASYMKAFEQVQSALQFGDSFLLNLTFSTPVEATFSTKELFDHAYGKYKLRFGDQFVCFSPECFVEIEEGRIATFPMKGTIDADLPNASTTLLQDEKEKAEHHTIVDLLRNDLSLVAEQVEVPSFRYLDLVKTHGKNLLQASSRIEGKLRPEYVDKPGTAILKMLPAGSISGAPKVKTMAHILEAETHQRGFYTGVFGVFDGNKLQSAVMIRFMERTSAGWVYKSGGGITAMSEAAAEYQEMIDKVYVPMF